VSTYTSQPVPTIFQGVAQIPSHFIVNYRSSSSGDATITFYGIDENGDSVTLNSDGTTLPAEVYDARIVCAAFAPIIGYYYTITNVEYLSELTGITMVTKHGIPITQFKS
jgi:hypothetical protein